MYLYLISILFFLVTNYLVTTLIKKYTTYNKSKHKLKYKWHWDKFNIEYGPPLYQSMICACRLSRKFLYHLNAYVKRNKKLCNDISNKIVRPRIIFRYFFEFFYCIYSMAGNYHGKFILNNTML